MTGSLEYADRRRLVGYHVRLATREERLTLFDGRKPTRAWCVCYSDLSGEQIVSVHRSIAPAVYTLSDLEAETRITVILH